MKWRQVNITFNGAMNWRTGEPLVYETEWTEGMPGWNTVLSTDRLVVNEWYDASPDGDLYQYRIWVRLDLIRD